MNEKANTRIEQFREQVYQSFTQCADALMDLMDALCSQTAAQSVAELSLEACFRREYSSLYKAIDQFLVVAEEEIIETVRGKKEKALLEIIAGYVPMPERQAYWLLGTDATPAPRQFARTVADRGYVYYPNAVADNKPVTIGHQYVVSVHMPEREAEEPPWAVPLIARRVSSQEKEAEVGAALLTMWMDDETLPWHGDLCVHVGDSRYSTPEYLSVSGAYENLVTVSRFRSNRTVHRQPKPEVCNTGVGHPTWFGEAFRLLDPTTWHEADETLELPYLPYRKRVQVMHIQAWHDMLMRGKKNCPMHKHPFTLLRIQVLDPDGKPVFKPWWLIISGQRRAELTLEQAYTTYDRRSDQEHFFRFAKQRLLLTRFQTPDLRREENWWQIVQLAYTQLWLARPLAENLPRPWERYLPRFQSDGPVSPSTVQRDFKRIIRQLGTPAADPKPRGYSPGRSRGTRLPPRVRSPVVKKGA
jgi:hypothetical protein